MAGNEKIAVLGAGGTMGMPIARNLARAGFDVSAWNRSAEKAAPLAQDGAKIASSAAEAGTGASIVLTMLADADVVIETMGGLDGALGGLADEAIWLQMSTIGEAGTERCARLAAEHGLIYIDAPVLGTKQPAEEKKLVVFASGPPEARERVQPVFDALGRTIWLEQAGEGTRLKLVANNWLLTVVEGTAETIALAQGLGVDPALFLDAVQGGALDLPYMRMKGKAIIDGNFEPLFQLKLAVKDARLVNEAARAHQLDLPLPRLIHDRMQESVAEHGEEDLIATYWSSAPESESAESSSTKREGVTA